MKKKFALVILLCLIFSSCNSTEAKPKIMTGIGNSYWNMPINELRNSIARAPIEVTEEELTYIGMDEDPLTIESRKAGLKTRVVFKFKSHGLYSVNTAAKGQKANRTMYKKLKKLFSKQFNMTGVSLTGEDSGKDGMVMETYDWFRNPNILEFLEYTSFLGENSVTMNYLYIE